MSEKQWWRRFLLERGEWCGEVFGLGNLNYLCKQKKLVLIHSGRVQILCSFLFPFILVLFGFCLTQLRKFWQSDGFYFYYTLIGPLEAFGWTYWRGNLVIYYSIVFILQACCFIQFYILTKQVPYFCLPANELVDVIAPSCYR